VSWFAVDLDGTLAHYDGWRGVDHIGEPIEPMKKLVLELLADGKEVRIFTARVGNGISAIRPIEEWCLKHLGIVLPITNVKDFQMVMLFDDRCVAVEMNTGRLLSKF
jgi:hypothetical protein